MSDEVKVAAVVVWYEPDLEKSIKAISSYNTQVDKIYVIDNSDINRSENHRLLLKQFNNVVYIPLRANHGIAKALNVGFHKAIDNGFNYVLTFDQDSFATDGMISKLTSTALKLNHGDIKYGIIAAQPDTPSRNKKIDTGMTEKDSVIASGNLVSAEAFLKVGGFNEELFIDYVDCWFSLAIRNNGFKIIQVNDAVLKHNLGNIKERNFLGVRMYPTNHSPIRHYYISRNRKYTKRMFGNIFPEYFKYEKANYLKVLIKLILFEQSKFRKLKMILKGRRDYKNNTMGKLS